MKTHLLKFENLKNSTISNSIKLILFIFITAVSFSSCEKDDDNPQQEQVQLPDGQALNQRFLDNRQEALQTFTIDASAGGTVTAEQGTQLIIPANAFGLNGAPVSGNIDIEIVEIYSKGQMLLNNMPANGKRTNGDVELIKSAGEFYINATQNGNQLEVLSTFQLASKPLDFADVDNDMGLFIIGCDDPLDFGCQEAWEEDTFTQVGMGEVFDPETQTWRANYIVDLNSFGWTNLDRWYNYSGELTTLNIDVPDQYNGNNCEVYLSYDGESSGLARMDVYDDQTGMFTEHFGKIPVGQEVHIIIIAEINGVLHYRVQATTIVQNHIEILDEPLPGTEADLMDVIDALP